MPNVEQKLGKYVSRHCFPVDVGALGGAAQPVVYRKDFTPASREQCEGGPPLPAANLRHGSIVSGGFPQATPARMETSTLRFSPQRNSQRVPELRASIHGVFLLLPNMQAHYEMEVARDKFESAVRQK
jgi:hypothetical protein